MFVNGDFEGMKGLIASDMLTDEQVDIYFKYAEELGITLDIQVKQVTRPW